MATLFQWYGGKSKITDVVWRRFSEPKQYIEPFLGSAAMILAREKPVSLEVAGDANGFLANLWRAIAHQPERVIHFADYPVSHIDLGGRHMWLLAQRGRLAVELQDPNWPGDAQVAGWWLWGQCAWIGGGWCDWFTDREPQGRIPHVSDIGQGIQAQGQIPHVGNIGQGIQAQGQIPHVGNFGRGGWPAHILRTSDRLKRVRLIHGDWTRCLNHHVGKKNTAIFFDPPYIGTEKVYGDVKPVALAVAEWCRANSDLKIALCGHVGDYDLPGWETETWSRAKTRHSGKNVSECIWFSPMCGS